jgi:type II secretory ATPase GspE/PulE/Tfp pilus assembly ATPase PilB-like protein
MEMSADLRDMTFNKTATKDIRAKAVGEGMTTLQQDAVRKFLAGITTIEEILRVTHAQDLAL